jgi:hypothetical protein
VTTGASDGGFDRLRQLTASREIDIRYIWQPDRGFRLSRSRNNVSGALADAFAFLSTVTAMPSRLVTLDGSTLEALPKQMQPEHVQQRAWLASESP